MISENTAGQELNITQQTSKQNGNQNQKVSGTVSCQTKDCIVALSSHESIESVPRDMEITQCDTEEITPPPILTLQDADASHINNVKYSTESQDEHNTEKQKLCDGDLHFYEQLKRFLGANIEEDDNGHCTTHPGAK